MYFQTHIQLTSRAMYHMASSFAHEDAMEIAEKDIIYWMENSSDLEYTQNKSIFDDTFYILHIFLI